MSINKTEPHSISFHQNAPFRGSLSFISGISSDESERNSENQTEISQAERNKADKELGRLQEELLLLIGELEEFVLEDE